MASQHSAYADNLRALRAMHHLSQSELAQIAEVSRETVNKWESGSISNIRTKNLESIARHFELSMDDLRSESHGLAAQNRFRQSATQALIPLLPPQVTDIAMVTLGGSALKCVEVPLSILHAHPHAFALEVGDHKMSCVLPKGCHAIVDPDMSDALYDEKIRSSNPLILLLRGITLDGTPVFRKVVTGKTNVLISTDSFLHNDDDVVMKIDEVETVGAVVWFQPQWHLPPVDWRN